MSWLNGNCRFPFLLSDYREDSDMPRCLDLLNIPGIARRDSCFTSLQVLQVMIYWCYVECFPSICFWRNCGNLQLRTFYSNRYGLSCTKAEVEMNKVLAVKLDANELPLNQWCDAERVRAAKFNLHQSLYFKFSAVYEWKCCPITWVDEPMIEISASFMAV